jgi:hypothetical protein
VFSSGENAAADLMRYAPLRRAFVTSKTTPAASETPPTSDGIGSVFLLSVVASRDRDPGSSLVLSDIFDLATLD